MHNILYIFLSIPFIFLINNFFKKKSILLNDTGDFHQRLTTKSKVPLSGGIYLIIIYLITFWNQPLIYSFFIFAIFFIGLVSDLIILKSPNLRFVIQTFIILLFVVFNNIEIHNTRIYSLDFLIDNKIINYFFVTFCILIIVNGTNFMDGVNTLAIGYFSLVGFVIFFLNFDSLIDLNLDTDSFLIWLLFGLIIYLFNFFNNLYLGDSGSYLLGMIYSSFLINIYFNNQLISPFFIILLLWYPAFENLFSIIRKYLLGKNPLKPDKNHLHQLIYFFLKKKYNFKDRYINTITGQLINFYNLVIFVFAMQNISNTQFQILLLLFSIFVYLLFYLKLFLIKFKSN